MEKVIPPGLNYADIKPEAIENQIRMIKFLPISNVQNQRPNDVVRFHLQGNGFFDPYSAYIKIRVQYDMTQILAADNDNQLSGVFLDRSAHSLINRLVIRSQGTELERIEQYDVMAAMINDMVYSNEQRQLHSYEGFASKQIIANNYGAGYASALNFLSATQLYNAESTQALDGHFGDRGFYKQFMKETDTGATGAAVAASSCFSSKYPIGLYGASPITADTFVSVANDGKVTCGNASPDLGYTRTGGVGAGECTLTSPSVMEFCIPIYSGIIGVLMPDKKLLPLSLLPLEVEFTLNPQAFYPVGNCVTRSAYTIQTFEIWTHTLFFEQELHRSLEAVVAQNGIFIHYTSFYLTPINSYNSTIIPKYHQLGCFLKSVESIHWVFLYQDYLSEKEARKLCFVSHSLGNLQLRNGMDLIPSEPIPAALDRSSYGPNTVVGVHNQLLIETYKAWNKMHDPFSDSAINSFNYGIDKCTIPGKVEAENRKPITFPEIIVAQKLVGRCQYGLSLVGEEIGQVKTIVSGKKTVLPFDLNFDGRKTREVPSIMLSYLKADFIIYVRPDLIVTRLGL